MIIMCSSPTSMGPLYIMCEITLRHCERSFEAELTKHLLLFLLLLPAMTPAGVPAGEISAQRYVRVPPSADGIGKVYMGREIAKIMTYHGAEWLERAERVK